MSILNQLLEDLKVIFLTETKCKIRFHFKFPFCFSEYLPYVLILCKHQRDNSPSKMNAVTLISYRVGDRAIALCRTPKLTLYVFSLPKCDLQVCPLTPPHIKNVLFLKSHPFSPCSVVSGMCSPRLSSPSSDSQAWQRLTRASWINVT